MIASDFFATSASRTAPLLPITHRSGTRRLGEGTTSRPRNDPRAALSVGPTPRSRRPWRGPPKQAASSQSASTALPTGLVRLVRHAARATAFLAESAFDTQPMGVYYYFLICRNWVLDMWDKDLTHRLSGFAFPSVSLPSTNGSLVDISALDGLSVVYAYPRTSPPDAPPIDGWDQIQGARGCTPQTREFAAHYDAIRDAGAERVFGLSTQENAYQAEMKERLHVPFEILSDAGLELADALGLPTFKAGGMTLLTRLTMFIQDGRIEKVLYPVEIPAQNPADVLAYLRRRRSQ